MRAITLLLALLWGTLTHAAAPFGTDVNTGFFGGTTTTAISGTFTTPGSGVTNTAVVVWVLHGDGAATGGTISSVEIVPTAGGTPQSATHVVSAGIPGTDTHVVSLYVYTGALSVSTQYDVDVTLAAAAEIWGYARVLHTVDPTTPVRDSEGVRNANLASAGTITNSLTTDTGDYVLSGLISNATVLFTDSGDQTDFATSTTSDARQLGEIATPANPATVQYTNSTGSNIQVALASISLQSPTGGGSVVVNPISGRGGATAQPVIH